MTKFLDMKEFANRLKEKPEIIKELIEDEPNYLIARTIIKERIKNGLSQEALAEKAKLTQTQVSRLENAQLGSFKTLSRALDALGLRIAIIDKDGENELVGIGENSKYHVQK